MCLTDDCRLWCVCQGQSTDVSGTNMTPCSDGGHDVDSSTELWDDGEDESHCSHCSTSLHNHYTGGGQLKHFSSKTSSFAKLLSHVLVTELKRV